MILHLWKARLEQSDTKKASSETVVYHQSSVDGWQVKVAEQVDYAVGVPIW